MRVLHYCIIIAFLFLTACSKKTTVILIPDDDGQVGEVTVSAGASSERLSDAYGYTEVSGKGQPGAVQSMTKEAVEKKFAQALEAQPRLTQSYLLYFRSGSADLQGASIATFPQIIQAINSVPSPEVTVIGHTDRTGDDAYNMALSIKRAKAVKQKMIEEGIAEDIITIDYYGENTPVIPTADNVSEPKNRRVEIFIR